MAYTDIEDRKSPEELTDDITAEIQGVQHSIIRGVEGLCGFLLVIIILGIVALVHFWNLG